MNRDPIEIPGNQLDGLDDLLVDDLCVYEAKLHQGDFDQLKSPLEGDVPTELRSRFEEYLRCVDVLNLARAHESFQLSDSDDAESPRNPASQASKSSSVRPANPLDDVADVPRPPRIGRFEILEQLGDGGHGIVFRAIDPIVRREVAIKVPRPELLGSMNQVTRFARETSIVGMLEHPNIVPIYESGCHGTVPYIVMPYVQGKTLAEWLAGETLISPRIAAEIVRQLALAASHAHERGVLHRDLKPGNILLAPHDSKIPQKPDGLGISTSQSRVRLEFVPKLTDFGSAKCDDTDSAMTRTGATIGTTVYMSPEQVEGRNRDITAQTDVYGLGVILYELLTGHPPFRGTNEPETLQKILKNDVPSFGSCRGDVPIDLAVICLKCLEKSPENRYTTARALSDDLQCFLNGESISARPTSLPIRVAKWCRRHLYFTAAVTAGLLGILTITSVSLYYNSLLVEQLDIAEDARQTAKQHELHALQSDQISRQWAYVSDMRHAKMSWDRGNVRQTLKLLERYQPQKGKSDVRDFAWWYLWREFHDASQILGKHHIEATTVAITRSGDMAASGGSDGTIKLWSLPTGKMVAELHGHEAKGIESIDFCPTGERLVSASKDGTVRIWDVKAGRELCIHEEHQAEVSSALYSPGGSLIASGGADGKIRLWDSNNGAPLGVFDGHSTPRDIVSGKSKKVRCLGFHPTAPLLVTGGLDGTIRFWDLNNGPSGPQLTERALLDLGEDKHPRDIAFEPNGNSLIAASIGCEVVQISLLQHNYAEIIRRTPEESQPRTLVWPTEDCWIVGLRTAQIRFANAKHPEMTMMSLKGHYETVLSIAASADAKSLVSVSKDGSVRYWPNFRQRTRIQLTPAESDAATAGQNHESVQWCDRYLVATDSSQRKVSIFRMPERELERTIPKDEADDYLLSSSGQHLLLIKPDGFTTCIRVENGDVVWADHLIDETWNVRGRDQIDIDRSDQWLLLSYGASLRVLSFPNLKPVHRLEHPGEVRQVRFLKRIGKTPIAVSTCRDNILRIWDVPPGQLLNEIPLGNNEDPVFLVVSSDDRYMAIGSIDQKVHVWNLESMTEFASISTNCKDVRTNSSFFACGAKFLVCSHGGLTLWNIQEDTESIAFPEFLDRSRGNKFAIAPDGNQLAVCLHGAIHFIDGSPKK